jgi:head-tail adaptor
MRAGRLRHKADVYVPASTTNEFGEVNASFELMGTYACELRSRVMRETNEVRTAVSVTQYDLVFRYYAPLASISKSSYFIVDGVKLHIISMANDGLRNRRILARCEERS